MRLVPARLVLMAEVRARSSTDEQRAGVADARRLGVGLHGLDGPRAELADAFPRAEQLLHLDKDGDAMEPVVGRQRHRHLVVDAGEATCFLEMAAPDAARDRRRIDVGAVVGVRDPVEKLEAPLGEGPAEVVAAGDELGDAPDIPGMGAELDVAEALGDRTGLTGRRRAFEGIPEALCDERTRAGGTLRRREAERGLDPLVHGRVVGHSAPHPGPARGLPRELAVQLGLEIGIRGEVDRVLHRLPHLVPVVLEGVRAAERPPELDARRHVLLQLESAIVERDRLIQFVAGRGKLAGPAQPGDGLSAKPCQFLRPIGPREIGVLRPHRLRVVVREVRRVLVAGACDPLDPGGEPGVELRPPRARHAGVRHVAGERVLEGELALAGE